MRGMVRRRRLVGAGATKPFAADGVVGDRLRGVWLTLASRWASPIAENCAESKAGRGRKALRSEDDGDETMPDARCAVSMTTSAIAAKFLLFFCAGNLSRTAPSSSSNNENPQV